MSTPFRLVATDLDGTLLRSDGTVSPRTRRCLAELDRRGVTVVFVTARPLRWMDELWPLVGAHGLAIVSNGAIVYDVPTRRVVSLRGIEVEPGLELAERIRAAVPGASFGLECVSGIVVEPTYDEPTHIPEGTPTGPLEQVWTEPAAKMLVRSARLAPQELRRLVLAAVGEEATATWSGDGLIEISAAGVTKGAALAEACRDRGIDRSEVVAFGDMPNDLAMLAFAGRSYAMANGDPAVLAAADAIAPSHDEDGVAQVLEPMFNLSDDMGGRPSNY